MTLPRISLVTPSFNQARFLEETLRSVHDQEYPNVEYIVIDGGSTDGSVDIIRRYEDNLAYWVSEPDKGQTHALIKGFARSTGDIQGWLNSDDILEPWALTEVAQFFNENPQALVAYADSTLIDVNGHPLRPHKQHSFNRFIWFYDYNFVPQPSTFWRRELYDRVGGLDPAFDVNMDGDLWIRFAEVTTIYHVRRLWSRQRFHSDQKIQRLREKVLLEGAKLRQRHLGVESCWSLTAKKVLAKGMRVAWKLCTGCYW